MSVSVARVSSAQIRCAAAARRAAPAMSLRGRGSGGRQPVRRVAPTPAESRSPPSRLRVLMDKDQQGAASTNDDGSSDSVLKLNIQGRHLKVTDSLRGYVEDQVEKCVSHFMMHHHDVNKGKNSPVSRIDVRLSARGGPNKQTKGPQLQKAEVTIRTTIGVVRAEVETDQAYNSIDEACRVCERKLRKLKEKAIAKGVWNGHGIRPKTKKSKKNQAVVEDDITILGEEEEEEGLYSDFEWDSYVESDVAAQSVPGKYADLNIYRKKQVDLIPMTIEDAVESLQFLGHDFFMFLDKDSNEIKVVYKRHIAGFGVLTPVFPPSS